MANNEVNMTRSQEKIHNFDYDEQEDLEGCVARWFIKLGKELNMDNREIDSSIRKKIIIKNKHTLTDWLVDAVELVRRQKTQMTIMMETIKYFKTEVIGLQGELLVKKDKQLKLLKNAVEETVKTAVDSGIQSYSAAVQKDKTSGKVSSSKKSKKVIKDVVAEEDRSRNLNAKDEKEELELPALTAVSEEIEETLHFEAKRVGWKRPSTAVRPVTETLADKANVNELQGELLVKQDEQLKLPKTLVEETVKTAVDSGIESYSAVVQKDSGTVSSSKTLTKGKKSVAAEEIGEKPHFETTRFICLSDLLYICIFAIL